MKIKAPTLNRDNDATAAIIAEIIPQLVGQPDPFAILEQSEMTYIQALWTKNGFDIEYQERDLMHHYQITKLLPGEQVIAIFQEYLKYGTNWKPQFEFQRKNVATFQYKLGYHIGTFVGSFLKGLRESRAKKRNSNQ